MKRNLGVCPKCYGENIEARAKVLRKCKDCGRHFGQAPKRGR